MLCSNCGRDYMKYNSALCECVEGCDCCDECGYVYPNIYHVNGEKIYVDMIPYVYSCINCNNSNFRALATEEGFCSKINDFIIKDNICKLHSALARNNDSISDEYQ